MITVTAICTCGDIRRRQLLCRSAGTLCPTKTAARLSCTTRAKSLLLLDPGAEYPTSIVGNDDVVFDTYTAHVVVFGNFFVTNKLL